MEVIEKRNLRVKFNELSLSLPTNDMSLTKIKKILSFDALTYESGLTKPREAVFHPRNERRISGINLPKKLTHVFLLESFSTDDEYD